MIPTFPKFKKLELTDKVSIENITNKFLPYSDYNFVSLWSWDTDGSLEISQLNGNLVIKMPDYVTNEPIYSFIGISDVDETIIKILTHVRQVKADSSLKLIPKIVIEHIKDKSIFNISEDRDNFDYVIEVSGLINMEGKKYRSIRNEFNQFESQNKKNIKIKKIDLSLKKTKQEISGVFRMWEKARKKRREDTQNELDALKKLLNASSDLDLEALGLYAGKKLVAFSIYEIIQKKYGIGHFHKADTNYKGIFQYLEHHSARNIHPKVKYINYEQDLGIEGLRKSKMNKNPAKFLKKYTIRLRGSSKESVHKEKSHQHSAH